MRLSIASEGRLRRPFLCRAAVVRPKGLRLRLPIPLGRILARRIRNDASDSEVEVNPAAETTVATNSPDATVMREASGSRKLMKRATFGILLGLSGIAVVLTGGLLFSCIVAACSYQVSREFNGLVISMRNERKTFAPPNSIRELMSVFCLLFPLMTYFYPRGGKSALLLSVAAFILLCMEVLFVKKPKFSQLTAAVFGLFYCGFLSSFWVKLRMITAPAVNSVFASSWPVNFFTFGDVDEDSYCAVGLMATFVAATCVSFADTGAYFVGRSLGRTQLTLISPKKTVEGAFGGLLSSVLVALAGWKVAGWPGSPLCACAIGSMVFVSSLFGDLIESILKREAGMKDSGSLIPGHGGLLDRLDSYMFTGAVVYLCVKSLLPNFGL